MVQEISSASKEQSSGIGQIGKATTQLDTVIQQNAAASEELASMAEELSGQSSQLIEALSFFKLGEDDGSVGLRRGGEAQDKAPAEHSESLTIIASA